MWNMLLRRAMLLVLLNIFVHVPNADTLPNPPIPLETTTEPQVPELRTSSSETPNKQTDASTNKKLSTNGENSSSHRVQVPNYNEITQIQNVNASELGKFKPFFFEDRIDNQTVNQPSSDLEFNLCDSQTKLIYPQVGQTLNSGWQFIVQMDHFRQGIREESCLNVEAACKFDDSFPAAYTSRCKQYYGYRSMVSIQNGSLSLHDFIYRSACKCVLTARQLLHN